MEDYFNKTYLNTLRRNSKDLCNHIDLSKPLLEKIQTMCIEAASKNWSSIEVDVLKEYKEVRTTFFSPDEFGLYCAHICNILGKRNLKIKYSLDDGMMTISWY